ncbi:MAG: glycoside hydrolase family 95 protein [Betaproteobacteria bacterium]|nr:glycoside hydrolase family 95 protein [Betaproteobacteria bacterium]NBU50542.1 glycoside hydrolase family 95 protein [Betaproteobacteria bacterium]
MHPPDQKLWYAEPATKFTEALPVGNGRLGAMVFGGTQQERLLLNENSVWSGNRSHYDRVSAYQWLPEVRRLLFAGKHEEAAQLVDREILGERPLGCYQPLGALALLFEHRGPATDYRRELDLDCAVARVQFRVGDASFTREVFASAPDQVLVVRLTCDQPGRISFIASLSRVEHASLTALGKDTLVLRGQTDHGQPTAGVKFEARVKTLVEGGVVHATAAGCRAEQADAVTLLLAAATDDGKMEPAELCARHLAAAAIKTYAELREAHLADYRKLYRRVSLDLGNSTSGSLPTDQRLLQPDPSLAALYFQYGRYLLISSSRPGHLPANLQGLWNDQLQPAWFCGYHFNINLQMNYWPAEVCNLAECHEPLFDLVEKLRPLGRKTARDVYGCGGFVVAHRTTPHGFTSPVRGLNVWPVGAAWLCQHFWEHVRFRGDREFLAQRAYPLMKEVAEFFLDWLVQDPATGKLVSGPSLSPENSFVAPDGSAQLLCMGPAMDQQIIAELFDNCLAAAAWLGMDDRFVRSVEQARRCLMGGARIGADGRLLEWAREFQECEPGHRHTSHLYALYPGSQLTPRGTPELAVAARKSLEHRLRMAEAAGPRDNGKDCGWSHAWKANLWARLGDGIRSYRALASLISDCTYPNLMDMCPNTMDSSNVFQIDGNLGGCAGIAEMLLQSHTGEIQVLPALPEAWPTGRVTGLRARGGFTVDIAWHESRARKVTIAATVGGTLRIVDPWTGQLVVRNLAAAEVFRMEP